MGASLFLGYSAESGSGSVGLMITIALFFHKAPEAAGYGTFIAAMNCATTTRLLYIAVSLTIVLF